MNKKYVLAIIILAVLAGGGYWLMSQQESGELTLEEAMGVAQSSECAEKGNLAGQYMYNEYTKTWWIDLDMRPEFKKDYCNPACVVSEEAKAVEINWRCNGVLPPQ